MKFTSQLTVVLCSCCSVKFGVKTLKIQKHKVGGFWGPPPKGIEGQVLASWGPGDQRLPAKIGIQEILDPN